MAWSTPKTNWVATDPITYVDYNRIINNLKYIQNLCKEMYYEFIETNLGSDKTESDVPYADMLNNIENTLERINNASYHFEIGNKTVFSANSPYFTYTELNRIESITMRFKTWLEVQKSAIPTIAFTLGDYRGIRL